MNITILDFKVLKSLSLYKKGLLRKNFINDLNIDAHSIDYVLKRLHSNGFISVNKVKGRGRGGMVLAKINRKGLNLLRVVK
jgi:DNA-binding PadR family transcriptional regulator